MAPKVKPPKIVYETKESMYERALMMIDDAKWAVSPKFTSMHFQRIIEMLETLEGYKDSAELIKLCEEKIAQTVPEQQEMTYVGAVYIQEHAVLREEYIRAAALFAQISGYKDADERRKTCEAKEKQMKSASRTKNIAVVLAVTVIIAAGAAFFISKVRSMGKVDVHGTEQMTEVLTGNTADVESEKADAQNAADVKSADVQTENE